MYINIDGKKLAERSCAEIQCGGWTCSKACQRRAGALSPNRKERCNDAKHIRNHQSTQLPRRPRPSLASMRPPRLATPQAHPTPACPRHRRVDSSTPRGRRCARDRTERIHARRRDAGAGAPAPRRRHAAAVGGHAMTTQSTAQTRPTVPTRSTMPRPRTSTCRHGAMPSLSSPSAHSITTEPRWPDGLTKPAALSSMAGLSPTGSTPMSAAKPMPRLSMP
jgi:hypothetical protein